MFWFMVRDSDTCVGPMHSFFSFRSNTQATRGLGLGGDRSSPWGIGGIHLSVKLIIHPGCCGQAQTPEGMDVLRGTRHM